jgi:hypothetical protein
MIIATLGLVTIGGCIYRLARDGGLRLGGSVDLPGTSAAIAMSTYTMAPA